MHGGQGRLSSCAASRTWPSTVPITVLASKDPFRSFPRTRESRCARAFRFDSLGSRLRGNERLDIAVGLTSLSCLPSGSPLIPAHAGIQLWEGIPPYQSGFPRARERAGRGVRLS